MLEFLANIIIVWVDENDPDEMMMTKTMVTVYAMNFVVKEQTLSSVSFD